MPRERIVEAFILKRMDYGEADHIITLFSKEEGKVRALVKAAKLPTSKLQPLLQPIFETRVTVSGQKDVGLSKVIGVQLIKAYGGILEDQAKMAAWYVVTEILMKSLPDSAPNEPLFFELEKYAQFLHETQFDVDEIKQSVAQFQIKALATLGLGIRSEDSDRQNIWFSLDRGGFVAEDSIDAIPVKKELLQFFKKLVTQPYSEITGSDREDSSQLSALVNRFVTHQLEREIKSQRLLTNS